MSDLADASKEEPAEATADTTNTTTNELSTAVVTEQPQPTQAPQIAFAPSTDTKTFSLDEKPRPRPRCIRLRIGCIRFNRTLWTILSGLGRVFKILLMSIGVICIVAVGLALSFGMAAATGTISMLIGNVVLRSANWDGYIDSDTTAASIGAAGGIFGYLCVGIFVETFFSSCKKVNYQTGQREDQPWYIQIPAAVLGGTLSAVIGCSIFQKAKVDTGGLDVLHAARAGTVGGAILGPGSILLVPVCVAGIMIILSPLWLALAFGVEWIHTKSTESWTPNSHSYSTCVCVGTCGDDPEIQSELARIDDIHARHRAFGNRSPTF